MMNGIAGRSARRVSALAGAPEGGFERIAATA
jgi:hypothetical protein